MIMKLVDCYKDAIKNGYALGAFNFCNLESLKAILNAAQKNNSPVIVAVSSGALKYMGDEYVKGFMQASKKAFSIPMFFHLDHGKDYEICEKAINLGFDSVMIDGSALEFEENIKLTKKVADLAHSHGVQVEGELGRLLGTEDEHVSTQSIYTSPKQAKQFVEQTGVDSLAIAIGTSHGISKFSGEPKLAFDILEQIQTLVPNFPFVLHGASSVDEQTIVDINNLGGNISHAKGVPETMLEKACTKYNVCKINVDTDIRMATTRALRRYFKQNPESVDTKVYFKSAQDDIEQLVSHKICDVFHSNNKAK